MGKVYTEFPDWEGIDGDDNILISLVCLSCLVTPPNNLITANISDTISTTANLTVSNHFRIAYKNYSFFRDSWELGKLFAIMSLSVEEYK